MSDPSQFPPGHVDARFVLANERTYLAWTRTALALTAGGLAVIQLVRVDGSRLVGLLIGLPLIGVGALVSALGYRRYRNVDRALLEGRPLPISHLPALLTVLIVALAVTMTMVFVVVG